MGRAVRGKRRCAGVLATSALLAVAAVAMAETVELPVPAGVLPPEVPEDNPLTAAKVELGKKLYFDARI